MRALIKTTDNVKKFPMIFISTPLQSHTPMTNHILYRVMTQDCSDSANLYSNIHFHFLNSSFFP